MNTLIVRTNESYENFLLQLQKEIEEDEGIQFGVVRTKGSFLIDTLRQMTQAKIDCGRQHRNVLFEKVLDR
tara:strand:- start:71 stop:283 length:213 start_codon:yes stop_codon:yes gene_type:complete